jgi:hypothetical protein
MILFFGMVYTCVSFTMLWTGNVPMSLLFAGLAAASVPLHLAAR